LRHPNIVKYFYSEESPLINQANHFKCLLITEYIRPLATILKDLSSEQIIHGIYGVTQAVHFLHDKVKLSHNNINESCIYLNSKQSWKLNNFELAIPFSTLNKQSLNQILEFKNKNSITPEEEEKEQDNNFVKKYDLDLVYKTSPHAIDSYGWGMFILNVLTPDGSNSELGDLENFLNKDPRLRPTFSEALNLKLFELNKPSNDKSILSKTSTFDPFQIRNLDELEANYEDLMNYLVNLNETLINENLINLLLSPFMFFSLKVRKQIFPSLFIPKNEASNSVINDFYYYSIGLNKEREKLKLKSFLTVNNYKAFVIPKLLVLFSIHSTQIRLGLLEFFPFYVQLINDNDTLKYEILPELLVGLKDKNDELVSITFSCLSVMVKLLGGQIVVGSSSKSNDRRNIFSDNLPKKQLAQLLDESKKLNSFASLDEEMMLMMLKKEENLLISESNQKLFSDSMIGLHDDTDDNSTTMSIKNEFKLNSFKNDDDWSNDFGVSWNLDQNSVIDSLTDNSSNVKKETTSLDLSIKNRKINDNLDQFDIKNIKLTVKSMSEKKEDDLIDNFLNEMQPVIKKTEVDLNEIGKNLEKLNSSQLKVLPSMIDVDNSNSNWECEEIVDLEDN
jgi:SCY1-like protein 3